jgi:hypothetical protein
MWVLLAAAATSLAATRLPFVQNNAAIALAEAKARKIPVFVEVWAPW